MKKLLSLLSVLTISGTAVPAAFAASPYQKEETIKNNDNSYQQKNNLEKLSRVKRGVNGGNEIEASKDDLFPSFKPDLWEEIRINYYYYSNLNDFQEWFKNRMNAGVWQDHRISNSDLKGLAKNIWNNWNTYNNIWKNSSKRQRIRIKCAWDRNFSYRYASIRTDDRDLYPNWRLDMFNSSFNYKKLGILNDNNSNTILNAVKAKNPSLDISQLEVTNKTHTSATVKAKNNSNYYSNTIAESVYFTVKQSINEVITNTQLGIFNDNNSNTILNAVKAKNPSLDINEVNVGTITSTSSDINGSPYYNSNKYQGYKKVYFTVREDLNSIISKSSPQLFVINSNIDKALLNELNYLNPSLDISQLEVTNKTHTSATVKAKNNSSKYFGEKKIYYVISNEQNKIINLDELIRKGIFLKYRDQNMRIIKEIKNINTDNLIYSNVIASKSIEPIFYNKKENICYGKTILENNLSTEQKLRTSNCKYTIQEVKSFQITTGLSKTTGLQKTEEKNSGYSKSSSSTIGSQTGHSQSNSSTNSWEKSFNVGINYVLSIGWSNSSGGQTSSTSETSSSTMYNSTQEISKSFSNLFSKSISLSNSFDLGNSQEKQSIKIFELELPFQELNVKGNQTIEINTFLDKVLSQIVLNLKQNINGEINAIILLNDKEKNIKLSIKEIMQKLQQYDLLPQEININNDDSITFNGKANFSYHSSTIGKTSIREIETFKKE